MMPENSKHVATYCCETQDHGLDEVLDHKLIELSDAALKGNGPVDASLPIHNYNRTVGAMLSGKVAAIYGEDGLPNNTIQFRFQGSAGQSFGAFLAKGVHLTLEGDSNDYIGKGMSGGQIVVYPPKGSTFVAEDNIIVGNVALYGATGGEVYINGKAGERFCVRNSAANAVVEGIGNHGCEYMTGGIAVILGEVGNNFAAGMSGGIAYVYDKNSTFINNFNSELSNMSEISINSKDENDLKNLIKNHVKYTNSEKGKKILLNWREELKKFKKVIPRDYEKILDKLNHQRKRVKVNG